MRTFLLALLLGAIMVSVTHADEVPGRKSWFQRWFGKNDKKAHPPTKEDLAPPPPDPVKVRADEMSAWMRRAAVCDKLQCIALSTNDEDLKRKADQLTARSWELYQKRTASLPSARAFRTDDHIFAQSLGLGGDRNVQVPANTKNGNELRTAAKER